MLVVIRRNKKAKIIRDRDRNIPERQSISRILKHKVGSRSRQPGGTLAGCHTDGLLEYQKELQKKYYDATGCLLYHA